MYGCTDFFAKLSIKYHPNLNKIAANLPSRFFYPQLEFGEFASLHGLVVDLDRGLSYIYPRIQARKPPMSLPLRETDPKELCLHINAQSPEGGLFEGDRTKLHPDSRLPWRISPEPFWITAEQLQALEELGQVLLRFYQASNLLYQQSVKGIQPAWVHRYLDQGKPAPVVEFGRMNRFKSQLPLVIRPDLLLTEEGFRVTELDSVPGGMGFTGHLSSLYGDVGYELVGGSHGLIEGFYQALTASTQLEQPVVAIVVSDESAPYREEMQWLAHQLEEDGRPVYCLHPQEIRFNDEGLLIEVRGELLRVDAVYRFFELFDLKNIPKVELITYFAKKNAVRVTPPLKAYLEEKMWLALFRHPLLQTFWQRELDRRSMDVLRGLVPESWILDSTPVPPHAVIPDLRIDGHSVNDWNQLEHLTKKQREFVIKPSGFSELAYGSRGVAIGHDLPEEGWSAHLQEALERFPDSPHILQEFHKSARVSASYYDFSTDQIRSMRGRALLRPYYYTGGEEAQLAGIQAILCPADKKILHGMTDAILVPCAVDRGTSLF